MEQSPSWEFNRFAASQEIPRILYNPKVHYRIHKCPATCPYPEPAQSSPYPNILLRCIGRTKVSIQVRGFVCEYFVTKIRFHGEELLAPRLTSKLGDHLLSAVRDCFFNTFAATLYIGGRTSIRNLRTHHAVVTGTHWSKPNNYDP
jgi:hypothetical protein